MFEVRISGARAEVVIAKLGFDYSFRVEATGFAGGIWLLWNEGSSVEFFEAHLQFIHVRIRDRRCCRPFLCTAVYASPHSGLRTQLSEGLDLLATIINEPWILASGFNVVMSADERQCGAINSKIECSRFRNFFCNHGFFDLGFRGPKFTWSKGQLFPRLGWAFCNSEWQTFAPNTTVQHLYKLKSDHCPLMVSMNPEKVENETRPFRFLASWLSHLEFKDVVAKG
ncbi:hypothetical protein PVK06_009779 [Gossypium arboreum]|uniref:Reverse transcriptase n=2 Tax=Gossypium arboreum TaxID=29729 RepID=A0ABR0QPD8_GOSAR|nr:hypothetical protein PVK06_009779 [Gossypium arboreum]